MLDLTEDDLVARPAVVDDAPEPRVVRHEETIRDLPELGDEGVGGFRGHIATLGVLRRCSVR